MAGGILQPVGRLPMIGDLLITSTRNIRNISTTTNELIKTRNSTWPSVAHRIVATNLLQTPLSPQPWLSNSQRPPSTSRRLVHSLEWWLPELSSSFRPNSASGLHQTRAIFILNKLLPLRSSLAAICCLHLALISRSKFSPIFCIRYRFV